MANDNSIGTDTGPAGPQLPQQAPSPTPGPQLAALGSAMSASAYPDGSGGQGTDVLPSGNPGPAPVTQNGAQPVRVAPGTPHAGLVNMIQSLALGVDAFATSAATKGQQGGVGEVQDYFAKQQAQKLQAEQAQREQAESDLRLKTMNASLLMNQMQYQHAMMMFPTQVKNAQLELQNNTVDAFTKVASTANSLGYDMQDPAQAQEARMRMGVGDATQQPGAITVPFAKGQDTQAVMDALTKSLPPGKSLTDYTVMPTFNDGTHGSGGQIIAVPANAPIMTMAATPRQIASSEAEVKSMIDQGAAAGLTNDPQYKALVGNFQNMEKLIDNGGKPTSGQLFTMHQSVMGPLSQLVAGKMQTDKIQEAQDTAAKDNIDLGQQRAANNAYLAQVPRDKTGNPMESFQTWQTGVNKEIDQAITQGDPVMAAPALVKGLLTLTDMKARGTTPAFIVKVSNLAHQLDPSYNPSDEIVGEKIESQPGFGTFAMASNSLTRKGGSFDRLQAAHQALGNTPFPVFNSWANLAAYHAGSQAQAAFKTALLAAADEYGKVLSGGNVTDSARDEGLAVFERDLSPSGFKSSIDQASQSVNGQMQSRIGGNRYLRQRYIQAGGVVESPQEQNNTNSDPFSQFGGKKKQ